MKNKKIATLLFFLILFCSYSLSPKVPLTSCSNIPTDSIALVLSEMYGLDQGVRDSSLHQFKKKADVRAFLFSVDSINFQRAIEIIKKYGWIDGKVLGETYLHKESINASLLAIFLHNPRRLNRHLRQMLISEVKKGRLSSSTCMLILDKYYVVCEHRTIFNTAFKSWLKKPYVKQEDKWLSDSLMNELGLPLLPNYIIK
ncbi:hypothetical protein O3603_08080 [Prevotella sp. 20925_1_30]|jgi:hypothetical protein|uniref:hypothetical protein n=1 Tax=Prevotella TaxID=838 RepID=UPI00352F5495